jgi:cyclic pyranopterin phosphate synthase
LAELISAVWSARTDRGAERRQSERFRGAFVGLDELRRDPHLEMHTRGG